MSVQTSTITDQQREFLREKNEAAAREQARWPELVRALLAVAGEAVAPQYEEDLEALLDPQRVTLRTGKGLQLRRGRPSECHSNAADLHQAEGHDIATGWALSPDGIWRQHSWAIHKDTGRIIETTELRTHYYGIILTDTELEDFLFYNY